MFSYEPTQSHTPPCMDWNVLRHDGVTSPVRLNKRPLTHDEAVLLAERLTVALIRETEREH